MATLTPPVSPASDLIGFADLIRIDASRQLQPERRTALGQYFTPERVARLMAGLSASTGATIRVLDPGAGVGVLTAAWVARACESDSPPARIEIVAYELDAALVPALTSVLERCRGHARQHGVILAFEIRQENFITAAVESMTRGLFGAPAAPFDVVIMNPPYGKIRTDSTERRLLREVNVETSNLYTAFVSLALRSLVAGGELIAITPRSFCNGPYFTPFRRDLFRLASLTHVHVFDSRNSAFGEDEVLQENVIFRLERGTAQANCVHVEWSDAGDARHTVRRDVPFSQVVQPGDADAFIHIAPDAWDAHIAHIVRGLGGNLDMLGVSVSTGRVVDFRVKPFLRPEPAAGTVPLIYPVHLVDGRVEWPKAASKKPNAIERSPETEGQLNPTGTYVLVKRFSSKEERRRIVAAVFAPDAAPAEFVAFENHLNYFHRRGSSLPRTLAVGLAAYLNSTLVDSYFRQFNGHTQVNATDLRKLPYPTPEQLDRIASRMSAVRGQAELDEVVEGELIDVPKQPRKKTSVQRRIDEACAILEALGLPKAQTNERAGVTLLALLHLTPKQPWSAATAPLRGVLPIMEFAAEHYGKAWKPNTRETVRRGTLHQFQDAGLIVPNPDKEDRPINSPAYCYQVADAALELLRSRGSPEWEAQLSTYLESAPALAERYAGERQMNRIPLRISEGVDITLSPGGQNELIREIIAEFCPRFTPGGHALYVGDADAKWGYVDEPALAALGLAIDEHGKMPDVVVRFTEKSR